MKNKNTYLKAWALLDRKERFNAYIVLTIALLAALSSSLMVGSIMPFLSVLTDPSQIREVELLSRIYTYGDFTSEYDFLVALGALSLVVIIGANSLQIIRSWAVARFSLMRIHSLSHRLLKGYLSHQYEYFIGKHTDKISAQILAESQEVVANFFRPFAEMLASILTIISILVFLIWLDPLIAATVFTVLGLLFVLLGIVSQRIVTRSGEVRLELNKVRYRIVGEAFGALKEIKLLGRETNYISRYCGPSIEVARALARITIIGETPRYVMQIFGFGGIILMCLLLLDADAFKPGMAPSQLFPLLGVYAFAGQRLLPEFSIVYNAFVRLNYCSPAVNAVYEDLVIKQSENALPSSAAAPLGLKQELRLDALSYHYPSAQDDSVSELSLTVKAGQKIGIVGGTGAGKTTLADLILGLLKPSSGQIIVDGRPVTSERIRAWQQTLGYVPQDIFLIDASVSENIALGFPADEIDMKRVMEAAKIANINDFVQAQLPDGYESTLGENGVRLSGGQRQRIGIARALYHQADLIMFDEATSALDNVTEREVIHAIDELPGNKTIFIIAHRMSTVKNCDKIAVLEDGKLTGFAAWDELAQSHPLFQRLIAQDD